MAPERSSLVARWYRSYSAMAAARCASGTPNRGRSASNSDEVSAVGNWDCATACRPTGRTDSASTSAHAARISIWVMRASWSGSPTQGTPGRFSLTHQPMQIGWSQPRAHSEGTGPEDATMRLRIPPRPFQSVMTCIQTGFMAAAR
ncbi:MAG: hypothetical protein RLZZ217_629 [Planctomycetota bacterium]